MAKNRDVFAKNLKYYLARSGKDRKDLCDDCGFPYSTVTEWLTGKTYPRIDNIETLARYFGIRKSQLIEERIPQGAPITWSVLSQERQELIEYLLGVPEEHLELLLRIARAVCE